MGGNAFKAIVPDAGFPRMPPPVYSALKAALFPLLQQLYARVAVSPEAPEKADYGDLDFIVCGPREGLTQDEVKAALRATHSVPMEGNRTSNFAIAVDAFGDVARLWEAHASRELKEPESAGSGGGGGGVFVQVDVNVCADEAQLERTWFHHSYGDLGMMLGLLVQTAGLSLGIYGLKLAEPIGSPPQTFYLSDSMADILAFLGLSMERWKSGFATQDQLIRWVASSPFAAAFAARLQAGESKLLPKERGEGRPIRQKFIKVLREHQFGDGVESVFAATGERQEKIHAALQYFGKREAYEVIVYHARANARAKALLNGRNVEAWTGVIGMPVRLVMDEVKERLATQWSSTTSSQEVPAGADVPPWQSALLNISDEEVRILTVNVKEELDAAGKLAFNWRAAKAAKEKRKKL
ncbi:hypothetical protein C8Q77DRAFT_1218606 [Trametes polyzona]|nr:hypothetical protein C8Q77DRAFT_1218606 [Trametes polyzona]